MQAMALRQDEPFDAAQRGQTARLVLLVGAGLRVESHLSRTLAGEGMRCLWLGCVAQALEIARLALFDAVVLESADVDGRCGPGLAQVRQLLHCPIVVVAQHADEIDEIMALELGADAFLVGPVAPRRLRAHLMALMRPVSTMSAAGAPPKPSADKLAHRAPNRQTEHRIAISSGWALDTHSGSLTGCGRRIELTVGESALMQCLVDAAGRVVSAPQLTAALPRGPQLAPHSVYVYIGRLRKRLRNEGVHELRVESVRGRGFALRDVPPGSREPASAAASTRQAAFAG